MWAVTELTDNFGADAWIAWAKRKAEEAAAGQSPEPRSSGHQDGYVPPSVSEEPEPEPEPAPLSPDEARRAARNAAFKAGAWV